MIKVPVLHLLVKLDMSTTTNVMCAPHEMALLTLRHGKGNVNLHKVTEKTRMLDPEAEYERLERKYGFDKETKRRWVEIAFGQYHEGRLESTMKQGAKAYLKKKSVTRLSPQQKAANTRAANKLAEEQNAEDPIAVTG